MVSFKTKKIESLSLGEVLKRAREEKGVEIEIVAEETRVQKKYLDFLEKGDYEKMPADVYTKGFLRQYGHYLDLDVDKLVILYNKEKSIAFNIKSKGGKVNISPIKEPKLVITPKIVFITFLSILVVSIFIYLWRQVGSLIQPPILNLASPSVDIIVNSDNILVSGSTDQYVEVTLNGKVIEINDEGEFNEEYTLQKGLNIIELKAINKLKKETSIIRKVIKE